MMIVIRGRLLPMEGGIALFSIMTVTPLMTIEFGGRVVPREAHPEQVSRRPQKSRIRTRKWIFQSGSPTLTSITTGGILTTVPIREPGGRTRDLMMRAGTQGGASLVMKPRWFLRREFQRPSKIQMRRVMTLLPTIFERPLSLMVRLREPVSPSTQFWMMEQASG